MPAFLISTSFLLFLLIAVPVSFAFIAATMVYLVFVSDVPFQIVIEQMSSNVQTFTLLAVPLFIFASSLMNQSQITMRIFDFAKKLVGFLPGGLGQVNVVTSLIFSGITGSAVAEAAGLGRIQIKSMKDNGYEPEFAAAITASSAIMGPIVPPSIPLVLYAMLSGASIGALFLAGFLPGILMALSLMVTVYILARKKNYPVESVPHLRELAASFLHAIGPLLTPVILVGGIVSGWFTPTESAAVACLYVLILAGLVYRSLSWTVLYRCLWETAISTGVIMIIYAGASVFAWFITIENIPQMIASFISIFASMPWLAYLIMILFVLLLGCFLDPAPVLLITTPIFMPLMQVLQIDVIHFGIIMVLTTQIGLLTPPMGMNLFIVQEIAGLPLQTIVRATLPYTAALFAVVLLLTYIPQIVLFLPNLIMP